MGELRSRIEAKSEEVDFLRLRQLGKDSSVRLSDSPLNLSDWPGRLCFFAVSNKRGYFVAATNDGFITSSLSSLRTALASNGTFQPQFVNKLASGVVSIKFTCDDDRIVVCLRNGRILVYNTPKTPGNTSSPPELPLQHEFSHSGDAIHDAQPNPHDRLELIAILRGDHHSAGRSRVEILDTKDGCIVGTLPGNSDKLFQTAICWSPKGKQLVVGHRNGQLVQCGVDGSQKGIISQSEADQSAREVVSVFWLENTAFFVVYKNPEEEHEYTTFVIINDSKSGRITDVFVDDPSPPWGMTSRESARFYAHLKSWGSLKHLLFVGDAPADDIGVVGCMESESGNEWTKFDLDDTARASVPMAEDGSPSSLIGLEVDLTSITPISTSAQFEDDSPPLPAAPILLVYTSEGLVQGYHILNSQDPVYPEMMPLAATTETMPVTPSTPPSKPAPPPFQAASSPVTSPAVSTTPAQPPPAMGFGAFAGKPPAFGAPAFGSPIAPSAFSQPAAPAFGQSTFGSTTPVQSPFAQPTFGASSFGTQPASATSTGFGFGAKPAAPAFGSSGFGTTPASAAPAFGSTGFGGGKGFGSFANSGVSGFGTSGFGTSTTPAQNTTTTQPAPSVPAFGKPTFGAPSSAFGSSGFGSGTQSGTGAAPPAFGAQTSAFSSFAKPSAIPPGTGAFGSSATSPSAFTTPAPKPASAFGATGFGSLAPPTSAFGAPATPAKPATPATTSTPPTTTPAGPPPFGSTTPLGTPSAPAFGSSAPLGFGIAKATDKPVFGSTTSFGSGGGFGAFAPKSTTPTGTPISAPAGSGFASFAATAQKGFGGGSSGSFTDLLTQGDGNGAALKPASPLVFGGPAVATPSKPPISSFTQRSTAKDDDDDEDSPAIKSKFPEEEMENKEPTKIAPPTAGLFGEEEPVPARPVKQRADVETWLSGLSFPSSRPPDGAPPSTPPTSTTPASTTPAHEPEPKIAKLPIPAPAEEEHEDGEGEEDEGEEEKPGDEEEEEEEEKPYDEEEDAEDEGFVISAHSESEGADTEEEQDTSGADASYVFAQHHSVDSLKSVTSDTNASNDGTVQAQKSNKEGTVSPPGSPKQPLERTSRSASPPSSTPSKTPAAAGPSIGMGKPSIFSSAKFGSAFTPVRSSPLASPPINNPPSPEKPFSPPKFGTPVSKKPVPGQQDDEDEEEDEDDTTQTPTNVKQRNSEPDPANRAPALVVPLPATDEAKTIKRAKTPPLFGFGQGSKPKPATTGTLPGPLSTQGSNIPRPVFGQPAPTSTFTPAPIPIPAPAPIPAAFGGFGGFAQKTTPPPLFGAAPQKPPVVPPVPTLFGSQTPQKPQTPPVPKPSVPATPPTPKPAGLEGEFIRVIEITSSALDKLYASVSEFANSQQALSKSNAGLDARGAKWSVAELKSLRKVILNLEDDVMHVKDTELDLKKQISELEGMILKAETQHEEIRRFIRAKNDPSFAHLVSIRHLGPEHAENQHRLRKLIQTVSDRVQQLEDIVAESKKKVDRLKAGMNSMQTPTLEMISRSLNRIQSGAQQRIEDLDKLMGRMEHLDITSESPETSPIAVVDSHTHLPGRKQRISKPAIIRPPITPQIRAEAAAALNSERSGSRLKAALLNVRRDPLSSQHISGKEVTTVNGATEIIFSSRAARHARGHSQNTSRESAQGEEVHDRRGAEIQQPLQGKSSLGLPGVPTGLSFSRSTNAPPRRAPEIGRLPKAKSSRSYRLPSDDESTGGQEA
ncbi:hypothetical protein FRC02_008013 [Tulasnella sp. 418]|nr:hypothetical protein FRC02_008013 [Tulasnella sp. 418]